MEHNLNSNMELLISSGSNNSYNKVLYLNSNMELLICFLSRIGHQYTEKFKFQYGATNIYYIKNLLYDMALFKFQYGATNIVADLVKTNTSHLFKFQYGATNINISIIFNTP